MEDAFPAKWEFRQAKKLPGSRAPKKINPRRASSPYPLRCETCGKALTLPRPKAAGTPAMRLSQIVAQHPTRHSRSTQTESNIRDLVKLLDEETGGVASEQ